MLYTAPNHHEQSLHEQVALCGQTGTGSCKSLFGQAALQASDICHVYVSAGAWCSCAGVFSAAQGTFATGWQGSL